MNWEHWLTYTGVAIELIAASYYLWTIPKGTTRPQPVTWAGWTAIGAVGAWGARAGGAGLSFYIALSFVAVTGAVFLASLIPGYGHSGTDKPHVTDKPILTAAIILLILQALNVFSPAFHVTLAIIGDACFTWFTVRKAWNYPQTENLLSWVLAAAVAMIGILVLSSFDYAAAAFPLYLLIANLTLALTVFIGQLFPHFKGRLTIWLRGQ